MIESATLKFLRPSTKEGEFIQLARIKDRRAYSKYSTLEKQLIKKIFLDTLKEEFKHDYSLLAGIRISTFPGYKKCSNSKVVVNILKEISENSGRSIGAIISLLQREYIIVWSYDCLNNRIIKKIKENKI